MEDNILFDIDSLDQEYVAYQAILPFLQETIEENYAPPDDLIFQKNAEYSSVYFCKNLIFRIKIRKNSSYISISTKHPEMFPNMKLTQNKTDIKASFYRCDLADTGDIIRYSDELCSILDKAINSQPKECDICDLYLECSNSKKCVHKNREFSLHCGYKRILKNGIIFYGKNRNVDNY